MAMVSRWERLSIWLAILCTSGGAFMFFSGQSVAIAENKTNIEAHLAASEKIQRTIGLNTTSINSLVVVNTLMYNGMVASGIIPPMHELPN